MNTNEFRRPLLQSLALIVIFLLFFSFVISSGADNLRTGLLAVLNGTFHIILLSISLILSILLSISLLVLLFLAAMALYSVDKAKESWMNLLSALSNLSEQIKRTWSRMHSEASRDTSCHATKIQELENTLAQLSMENKQLRETLEHLNKQAGEKFST